MAFKIFTILFCTFCFLLTIGGITAQNNIQPPPPPKFDANFAPPPPPIPSAPKFNFQPPSPSNEFKLSGGGGGSPSHGYDLKVDAGAKVWESNNHRHSIHVNTDYSQHLGGPDGSSQPNLGGGIGYRFNFK